MNKRLLYLFSIFIVLFGWTQHGFGQGVPKRIYVSQTGSPWADGTSWEASINDLSIALSKANAGDSVWVSVGTYSGGFIMPEGVTVLGGFLGMETSVSQRQLPMFSVERSVLDGMKQYRVLEQPEDYELPTTWDGFVIKQGIGQIGAGVLLRKNGILRNCIVQGNCAGLPSIGEYLPDEGGVLMHVNATTKKGVVVSLTDFGRHYQFARAKEAVSSCGESGKTDWRLPSSSEILYLTKAQTDGLYAFTPNYYLLENTLKRNGGESLQGRQYWTSSTTTESGNQVAYCLHTGNMQRVRLNTFGYCKVRPVRNVTLAVGTGVGGGVYAFDGSTLSGCMVEGNEAAEDEDIHVEGEVTIQDTDQSALPLFMAKNNY